LTFGEGQESTFKIKPSWARLTPFQEGMLEKIDKLGQAYGASVVAVEYHPWEEVDGARPFAFTANVHVKLATRLGECEIWVYEDGAEVGWQDRWAVFEKQDYKKSSLEEAVLRCLEVVFSGQAAENPNAFPTAAGCIFITVYPFIWPMWKKLPPEIEEKLKKKSGREDVACLVLLLALGGWVLAFFRVLTAGFFALSRGEAFFLPPLLAAAGVLLWPVLRSLRQRRRFRR
jgi:hypothetical protein